LGVHASTGILFNPENPIGWRDLRKTARSRAPSRQSRLEGCAPALSANVGIRRVGALRWNHRDCSRFVLARDGFLSRRSPLLRGHARE
jgi:hypothetical protein